jgi:hypothetical protein
MEDRVDGSRSAQSSRREWPPPYYPDGAAAHMEALGMISAIYNHLEYTLYLLILNYSQLEANVAMSLFGRMTRVQHLKFLQDCSESRTKDNPMRKHVINFIQCFDIVADNRNVLMHSLIYETDDGAILKLAKTSKAAPTIYKELRLDVSVLRETAFDLQDVDEYGDKIWSYCRHRAPWSKHYHGVEPSIGLPPASPSFVKKLALPKNLLISDSQTPKAPKPPRISPRQRRELAMKTNLTGRAGA